MRFSIFIFERNKISLILFELIPSARLCYIHASQRKRHDWLHWKDSVTSTLLFVAQLYKMRSFHSSSKELNDITPMSEKHKGLLKSMKPKGMSTDLSSSLNSSQGRTKTNPSSLNESFDIFLIQIFSKKNGNIPRHHPQSSIYQRKNYFSLRATIRPLGTQMRMRKD
jgi:hypothetical protein